MISKLGGEFFQPVGIQLFITFSHAAVQITALLAQKRAVGAVARQAVLKLIGRLHFLQPLQEIRFLELGEEGGEAGVVGHGGVLR